MLETFSITQISKGGKVFIFSFFKLHSWVEEVFLFEEEKARLWIPIPILSFFIRYAMFIENLFLFFPLHIQWMRTTRVQGKKRDKNSKKNNNIFISQSNVPSSFWKQFLSTFTLVFFTLPWFPSFFSERGKKRKKKIKEKKRDRKKVVSLFFFARSKQTMKNWRQRNFHFFFFLLSS
jgi:hypothetical protein